MNIISDYKIFLIPLLVLVFTRIIKFAIFYFRHGRNIYYTFEHAMSYGHMPSVHTALMVSLVTSIGYFAGTESAVFALAIVLAIIIIDDATRLRVYMGRHGRYLNMLIKKTNSTDEKKYPRLKERMGHRLNEVIAGAIVGFILTVILINKI